MPLQVHHGQQARIAHKLLQTLRTILEIIGEPPKKKRKPGPGRPRKINEADVYLIAERLSEGGRSRALRHSGYALSQRVRKRVEEVFRLDEDGHVLVPKDEGPRRATGGDGFHADRHSIQLGKDGQSCRVITDHG
jgi:hypothetical protein